MGTGRIDKLKQICQTVWPILLPIVFEITNIISGEWCVDGKLRISTGKFITILIGLVYIGGIIYFQYKDFSKKRSFDDLDRRTKEYKNRTKHLRKTLKSVERLIAFTGLQIREQRIRLKKNNDAATGLSFSQLTANVCNEIYDRLIDIYDCSDCLTVNLYIKNHHDDEYFGEMIAHEGHISAPAGFGKEVPLKNTNLKYCYRILKKDNPEYVIHMSREEVAKRFNINPDICKYSQYIGIPITNSDGHVRALLEINILGDFVLFHNKDDIMSLIENHLAVFKNCISTMINIEDYVMVVDNKIAVGGDKSGKENL